MSEGAERVVVTGLGPVTSVGTGTQELWSSLLAARSQTNKRVLAMDVAEQVELPIASMPADFPAVEPHLEFLKSQRVAAHRDLAYALLATELAIEDAELAYDKDKNRVGMVQVFEAPGVEQTVSQLFGFFREPMPTNQPPRVYDQLAPAFYGMQPFLYVHLAGKAFGLKGFCTSVHNACSSGAYAIETAAQHLRSGQADAMIVMGGEAYETAVRLEWFRRLGLYADDGTMSPFNSTPTGFYVGEGAAALVLETHTRATARGATIYAEYLGGAFAHQAWKQTIPDARQMLLRETIIEVLKRTGVSANELSLIIPHGASTSLSDQYEASCLNGAIGSDFGEAVATVFKSAMGHLLASSGLVELLCGFLAARHGIVPPTVNGCTDGSILGLPLVTSSLTRPITKILKLFTGFTGHDASLLFQTGDA